MGPSRSGSTFHKDPNSTSAWNAVIRGSKKWIMYPPGITPPGNPCTPNHTYPHKHYTPYCRKGAF